MSERLLRLTRIEPRSANVVWRIQTPTPGVVLIDVDLVGVGEGAPLHWRAGTWSKPPLDVSLDRKGRLVGFQFVLEDEHVLEGPPTEGPNPDAGVPVFDVQGWPEDRYADNKAPVEASSLAEGKLRLRIGNEQPIVQVCQVSQSLFLAFSGGGQLSEIWLGPLPREDWQIMNALDHV